jgi:hypothetical protein
VQDLDKFNRLKYFRLDGALLCVSCGSPTNRVECSPIEDVSDEADLLDVWAGSYVITPQCDVCIEGIKRKYAKQDN